LLLFSQNCRLIELFARTRENFLYILAGTCTRLKAFMDSIGLGKFNRSVELNLSLRLKLTLVANEVNPDIFCSVLFDFLEPAAQIVKSLITSDVICKEYAMSSSIEDPSHGLK